MKRIIFLLLLTIMLSGMVFASGNSCRSDCLSLLKLSEKQKDAIAIIEKRYSYEAAQLRADLILRNMQLAKMKVNTGMLDFGEIQDEIEELNRQKEEEIVSNLGFIQRFKYRRCADK